MSLHYIAATLMMDEGRGGGQAGMEGMNYIREKQFFKKSTGNREIDIKSIYHCDYNVDLKH